MTRPRIEARNPTLTGLRILVIGLGRSGLAAGRLAAARGARVTVADRRAEAELGDAPERLRQAGIHVVAGGHPARLAHDADLLVVSPGVPPDVEILERARQLEVPVWGEVELASRFCRGQVVGITGSNGKSTVTAMVGGILRAAGIPGGTGGNLEIPFCELLEQDAPVAVHAVELSSFQLESVSSLSVQVAVVVNLSPDHLDRHASFDAYAVAKARLLELQSVDSAAVLNADNSESRRFEAAVRGRVHRFSTREEQSPGAFLRAGRLVLRTDQGEEELFEAEELPVPGEHNVANALAAALAGRLVGCPVEAIERGLRGFRALPHRLERVATIDGVSFFNDSKATNPSSVAHALAAFPPGHIHIILGGRDKGADWTELIGAMPGRAKRVLLVGESAAALRKLIADRIPTVDCGAVGEAVRVGFSEAASGDVVVLSPGCASFDQYGSFEERGEDFRRAVRALEEGRA